MRTKNKRNKNRYTSKNKTYGGGYSHTEIKKK